MGTKMGNNNFFRFLFQEKKNVPSKELLTLFNKMFKKAKNAEWTQKNDHFEVIFYDDDIEKIAEFNPSLKCISLKTNINPAIFHGELRTIAEKYGEIMNTIRIDKESTVQFEIIVRDKELTRYELLLDKEGKELKFVKL
jgi:hypothetical protein